MKISIYLKSVENGKNYDAFGFFTDNKVIVSKGSKINKNRKYKNSQIVESLLEDKNIIGSDFILKMDVEFSSLSTAGCFVTGNSTNGLTRWKVQPGISLKKYLEGGTENG